MKKFYFKMTRKIINSGIHADIKTSLERKIITINLK